MSKNPNLVIVMTDHTNGEIFDAGSPCLTPHLDACAAGATRFARCYTSNAICSPARASLMTGLYPSTHGMWDCTHTQRSTWLDVPADAFRYFSQNLQDAGYHNAYFGKWHVEQSNRLEDFGWNHYDLKTQGAATQRLDDAPSVTVQTPGYRDYLLAAVSDDAVTRTHPAFDAGIAFLETQANGDAPFCCFISAIEPHDPYVPPKRFFDLYDVNEMPLPETLRSLCADKPEVVRRMQQPWRDLSDTEWKTVRACYWAFISYLDHEFGRVMAKLAELGLDKNTIVVFTSDHGDMLGAQGLITKGVGTSYEQVYRIPLMIRLPGTTGGTVLDEHVVSIVDIAPTLLELAGAEPLPDAQGRSFAGVLRNDEPAEAWQCAHAEFFGQRFVYTQRITWRGSWKYVFSPGGIDELYDLSSDPAETRNRIDDPKCAEILKQMVTQMWKKVRKIGDRSLADSQYATLRTAPYGPQTADEA